MALTLATAGAITAGLSALGGLINTGVQIAENQKNRDFQVDYAKNAYGYQVQSMREAGLNPILAYGATPPTLSGGNANINPVNTSVDLGRDVAREKELKLRALDLQLREDKNDIDRAYLDYELTKYRRSMAGG